MSTTSTTPPSVWQTASDESHVWRAIAPARLFWLAAERRIGRATTPRPAIDGDRLAERVLAASAIVRRLDALIDGAVCAWSESATAAGLRSMNDRMIGRVPATRLRRGGAVMTIASATAIGLRALASTPAPFTWIMPTAFGVAGLLLIAGAPAIARTCEDRRA